MNVDRTPALVADMLAACNELRSIAAGSPLHVLVQDRLRCLATEKLFINLGEAARRVAAEAAAGVPGVPWGRIIGLRNILAHGYEQIDHEVLFRTVADEIPQVAEALEHWLTSQPSP